MLAMVSGGRRVRGQPARRAHLPLRAGAGRSRRRSSRNPRASRSARSRTRSTRSPPCCWSRRRCSRSPAGPPSSRSSATGSAPDGERRRSPGSPRRRRSLPPPRERIASWPLVDRLGYWLCWVDGHRPVRDRGRRSSLFMLVKGISYLRPSLFVKSPAPSLHQSQSGRLPRPDRSGRSIVTAIGIADRGARWAWRSPPGCRSTGARAWLARAVESGDRDDRRRAEHRARDLRAADLLAGLPRLPLPAAPQTAASPAQSFLAAGHRHGAARAAARRRRHARGARAAARPRARGLLRARQDARDDDPLRAAAGDPPEHRQRGRARAWAGSSATPRSSSILLGRDAQERTGRAASRCSARCAAPARRSRATSTTTRPPAKATRRRRPTRRRSCC